MMEVILLGKGTTTQPDVVLDRTLWVNAAGTYAVEDGDPEARTLLGTKGTRIPVKVALELGLIDSDDERAAPPPVKQTTPSRDKKRTITRNKSKENDDDGEE